MDSRYLDSCRLMRLRLPRYWRRAARRRGGSTRDAAARPGRAPRRAAWEPWGRLPSLRAAWAPLTDEAEAPAGRSIASHGNRRFTLQFSQQQAQRVRAGDGKTNVGAMGKVAGNDLDHHWVPRTAADGQQRLPSVGDGNKLVLLPCPWGPTPWKLAGTGKPLRWSGRRSRPGGRLPLKASAAMNSSSSILSLASLACSMPRCSAMILSTSLRSCGGMSCCSPAKLVAAATGEGSASPPGRSNWATARAMLAGSLRTNTG